MKMWNKKFLAAAVALSAMTGQVYAAETANTVDDSMPTYSLGEVVVTATRTEKKDAEVPAATTVITAEEIKSSGAATASAMLAGSRMRPVMVPLSSSTCWV